MTTDQGFFIGSPTCSFAGLSSSGGAGTSLVAPRRNPPGASFTSVISRSPGGSRNSTPGSLAIGSKDRAINKWRVVRPNPNFEIRNKFKIRMTEPMASNHQRKPTRCAFIRISDIWICFEFVISDFEFPYQSTRQFFPARSLAMSGALKYPAQFVSECRISFGCVVAPPSSSRLLTGIVNLRASHFHLTPFNEYQPANRDPSS